MTDLVALHKKVWDFRRAAQSKWPTPDPLNALRFAVTESSEALDCFLRETDRWVRNNDRVSNYDTELGDTAMMLLTSIPEGEQGEFVAAIDLVAPDLEPSIDLLCFDVAYALYSIVNYSRGVSRIYMNVVSCSLLRIAEMTDIEVALDKSIAKIAAKHGIDWQ